MRRLVALLLAAGVGTALAAPRDALFESSTEDSTAGWSRIPERLAHALIASGDPTDRQLVDEAIHDDDLAHDDAQFFRAKPIRVALTGTPMRFVRPPDKPYHQVFYGAHIFRFWLVDARDHIVFASGADGFAVLKSSHGGMRDLRVSQCHGGYCYDTTLMFVHGQYVDAGCTTSAIDGGATTAGCR